MLISIIRLHLLTTDSFYFQYSFQTSTAPWNWDINAWHYGSTGHQVQVWNTLYMYYKQVLSILKPLSCSFTICIQDATCQNDFSNQIKKNLKIFLRIKLCDKCISVTAISWFDHKCPWQQLQVVWWSLVDILPTMVHWTACRVDEQVIIFACSE